MTRLAHGFGVEAVELDHQVVKREMRADSQQVGQPAEGDRLLAQDAVMVLQAGQFRGQIDRQRRASAPFRRAENNDAAAA